MTEVPVQVAGAVVTALTVLTEGTVAVVCDSVVNVIGITVLSFKPTHTEKRVVVNHLAALISRRRKTLLLSAIAYQKLYLPLLASHKAHYRSRNIFCRN